MSESNGFLPQVVVKKLKSLRYVEMKNCNCIWGEVEDGEISEKGLFIGI
jgi:hypothetical protein